MTIRANRTQLTDRVDLVVLADFGEWREMMDLDVAGSKDAISPPKVEIAYHALCTPMIEARASRKGVAFESVDRDGSHSSLNESRRGGNLIRAILTH